jgi:hypothetical protein
VRTHNITVKKPTVKPMVAAISAWVQVRPPSENLSVAAPAHVTACRSKDLRTYLVLRLKMYCKVIFAEKMPAEIESVFMPNLPESRAIALTTHCGRTLPDTDLLQHVRRCMAAEPSRPTPTTAPQQPPINAAAVAATTAEIGPEPVAETETQAELETEADTDREIVAETTSSPRPTRPTHQHKRARSARSAPATQAPPRQRQRQHNQRSDRSNHRGAQARQQGGGIPLVEGLAQVVREEVTRSGRKRRAVTYKH